MGVRQTRPKLSRSFSLSKPSLCSLLLWRRLSHTCAFRASRQTLYPIFPSTYYVQADAESPKDHTQMELMYEFNFSTPPRSASTLAFPPNFQITPFFIYILMTKRTLIYIILQVLHRGLNTVVNWTMLNFCLASHIVLKPLKIFFEVSEKINSPRNLSTIQKLKKCIKSCKNYQV